MKREADVFTAVLPVEERVIVVGRQRFKRTTVLLRNIRYYFAREQAGSHRHVHGPENLLMVLACWADGVGLAGASSCKPQAAQASIDPDLYAADRRAMIRFWVCHEMARK
jgi:hypothetical protein